MNKNMKKTILTAVLVVGVACSLLGCGKNAAADTETNTEDILVDTVAPNETIKQRYIFINDIAKITDFSSIVEPKEEVSLKFIRFEKKDVLGKMDELALKNLVKDADALVKDNALKIGSEEIPTQPGIYRSVLEIADVNGNAAYEDVFIILDKTAAAINDADDVVVTVSKDKLSEKPEIDTKIYKGYDEVDGSISYDKLNYELTLVDETKHEWKLTISYTDRAGNYTEEFYKVTVVEEKQQTSVNNDVPANNTGNTNTGNANNGSGNITEVAPNIQQYDPRDTNKDGSVSVEEEMKYITPAKQKCIDGGYGVVVEQDGGEWYAVLTNDPDQLFNGKMGDELLVEYLKGKGLHADSVGGCWINSNNGWYWYTAEGITEIPESSGQINWDEIEWEDCE